MIRLSYILTTFNKLPYLRITLPLLIEACKEDEEIVVVDGGSTDGTADYLKKLFLEKKINQFVSEKDFGEAHGTNKAMMMAKGELIKLITDDDLFHYPSIQECKKFMVENPEIDILGSDGFGFNTNHKSHLFTQSEYINGFKKWQEDKTPFLMCGISYLFRKSSLAYMGIFNTNFIIIDIEYSVRISSMKTKIAFYTGMGYVNIVNPQSNSHRFYETISKEKKILAKMYPSYKNKISYKGTVSKIKDTVIKVSPIKSNPSHSTFNYEKIISLGIQKLEEVNRDKKFVFLT